MTLKEAREDLSIDCSTKYLVVRIEQGEFSKIRWDKTWKSSLAAINFYRELKGKE